MAATFDREDDGPDGRFPSDDSLTPTPATSPHRDPALLVPSPTNATRLHGDDDDDDVDDDDVERFRDLDIDMDEARGGYAAVAMQDVDDLDLDLDMDLDVGGHGGNQREAHRQQLASALAQLPRRHGDDQDEEDVAATMGLSTHRMRRPGDNNGAGGGGDDDDDDFNFLYSPADSPRAVASSTALIVASTALAPSTSAPAAMGPANRPTGSSSLAPRAKRNPYTGLSNQGATCYMNSLLQTMFMTPELRLGLYRWKFQEEDDESEEDNIPFQMQKLFAKLQLSSQEAISTKALTKSFGWTGADVFQQHDVQELCRVLFDALEKSFKGTVNETLVNDLYQGTMKDFVQCRTCGYESSRNDEFLDLSLVIRPFGSSKNMKSVEEAIEFFLKPEVLNGDNQWMCDRCNTKRDAIKGLKFTKLPYLLSLQLKRFDYDYMTDSRIKLHDQVAFPKYLDMNSYLHDEDGGNRGRIARKLSMERHELEGSNIANTETIRTCRMSSMDETKPISFAATDGVIHSSGVGEASPDTWSPTFDVEQTIQRSGPYVYELYSVLIHSGSALGGHYYAYIKALEDGKWYDFNDSSVSELSENEVKKAWGGNGSSSYGGRVSYSTCAYMLMYRLVCKDRNVNAAPKSTIPQYLIDRMQEEEARLRRQELERVEMAKKILIKFYMKINHCNKVEKSIHIYKTASLREALILAHDAFAADLGDRMPSIENTRLRLYNDYTGILSDTYAGKEAQSLQSLKMYSSYQLFLETKKSGESWEEHKINHLQLFLRQFHPEGWQPDPSSPDLSARYVQVEEDGNVASLINVVRSRFDVSSERQIRFVKKTGTSYTSTPVKILNHTSSDSAVRLRSLNLVNGSELYFEECDDLTDPSPAAKYFEREVNIIEIKVWYLDREAHVVRVDRRETVRTLKEMISARIGLASNRFKLLRGNHRAGIEIKTIDTTLYKLSIGSGHAVFALEGTPLGTGEYLFRLMLFRPLLGVGQDAAVTVTKGLEDGPNFDIDEVLVRTTQDEAELVYVTNIKVGEEMQVEDIRRLVWQTLKDKGEIGDSILPSRIRLRDLQTTTLTRILADGRPLKKASSSPVYEGRGIVAQILSEPEVIEPGHRVVQVVYVDRSKWRFSKQRRFELIVPKEKVDAEYAKEEEDEDELLPHFTPRDERTDISGSSENTFIPTRIGERLLIPPEQVRFAVFPFERDSFDICEIYKTDFDTWDRAISSLKARKNNSHNSYQLLAFATDADIPMSSFSARERMHVQDFLVKKRDETKTHERYNKSSSYRKPKETALVIRTKSKSSKKGGSNASSNDRSTGGTGVTIRTPNQRDENKRTISSDTDDEDDDDPDYLSKPRAVD